MVEFRPGRQVAVFGDLVQGDHVFAFRLLGVAAGDHQVAHRVVTGYPVYYFPGAELPLHDFGGDEESGVGVAFGVKLGVQRPQARLLHYAGYDFFKLQDGNAGYLGIVSFGFDSLQHFAERVHGEVGRQFAVADDVFASRIDVYSVGRLRRRQEVNQARAFGGNEHLDLVHHGGGAGVGLIAVNVVSVLSGHFLEFSLFDVFFRLFPVDGGDEVLVILRSVDFQQGVLFFRVIGSEEGPAVGGAFAGVRQVVVKGRQQHLEGNLHSTFRPYLNKGEHAFEVLGVTVDGHIFLWIGHAEAGAGYYILGVFSSERRTVVTAAVGNLDDLHGLERGQVDAGDTGRVVAIDKYPAPVGFSVGLRKFGVVGVVPGHEAVGGLQHGFGFFIKAIPFFPVHGKYRNDFQQAAGRDAINADLAAEATGKEAVEFVVLAGGDVHLRSHITGQRAALVGRPLLAAAE